MSILNLLPKRFWASLKHFDISFSMGLLFISFQDSFMLFAVYEYSAYLYVCALSLLLREKVSVEEGDD